MGYMVHHAIIVTGFDEVHVLKAHDTAVHIFGDLVTPTVQSRINGYRTFFVAPDGSKLGWEASNLGDEQRETFCNWLDEQRRTNHLWLQYAEVQYGDEEGDDRVLRTQREDEEE